METLTYKDLKGQTQIFNVGDEVFIADRPKYGKISKWNNGWLVDNKSITVDSLSTGLYELSHKEPSPILTTEQIEKNETEYMKSHNEDGRNANWSGGKRSRRKSRRSRKSRKSRR